MQHSDSAIGQIIDGYRILDVLGKGGMGIVYKAEDIALSRIVALKMIAPELATNDSFLRRFHDEARALARVESPFIVGVHAMRKSEDRFFIVMEFVDGWTLADEIEHGAIGHVKARPVLQQMLQALARAHGGGVIHRDIKPRNIMITQAGRVKVTDFGLAKLRRDDGASTATQGMAGTARYMSPEQVQGSKVDHRSDIYSLGMTMYEVLAGKLPFEPEEGTFQILKRIVEETFPGPDAYNPGIPKPLVEVVQKAIHKNPDDRYQTADEMLEALNRAYHPAPTPQRSYVNVAPQARPTAQKGGKKMLVGLAVVVALLSLYPISQFFTGDPGAITFEAQPGNSNSPNTNPPTTMARLTVTTYPVGAIVYVNQQQIGPSPADSAFDGGEISVHAEMEGYVRKDTMLTLQSGQPTSIVLELEKAQVAQVDPVTLPRPDQGERPHTTPVETPPQPKGALSLSAIPRGRVFVDGKSYEGSTELSLPVGPQTVRFEDPGTGTSKDTTIVVRDGQRQVVRCYFEHILNINARPSWATVAIRETGETYSTPIGDLKMKPGIYHITASRQGYKILEDEQTLVVDPVCGSEQPEHRVIFELEAL